MLKSFWPLCSIFRTLLLFYFLCLTLMLSCSTLIVYYLYLLFAISSYVNHSSISMHVIFLLVLQYGNQLRLLFLSLASLRPYITSTLPCSNPLCYDLITSTPNSELWYIWPHSETRCRVPHWCNPALTCSQTSDPTLPPVMSSLLYFLYVHCFTLPYLSFPVSPSVMPVYFCLTHIRYSRTHVRFPQTFLIRPQYLLDLDSPLFSFRTDLELYK